MIPLLLAAAVAFAFALVGTPVLIRSLLANGIGQPIREDGPQGHITKTGTPTMGGVMIVGGGVLGYLVAHLQNGAIFTWAGILTIAVVAGAGFVGLLDDWIKVKHSRNLGLNKRTKFAGLITVAVLFAWLCIHLADVSTELSFTRVATTGFDFGPLLWSLWAILLILGSTNAVNLTDGLDGLAAGSSTLSFSAFVVIAFWAFRHQDIYRYPQSLDLALVAAAMMGACAGFLWWNAAPARIFMGDTGSLAIGAGLAALALTTNTHLLLPVIGGLYVAETLSVILQVASYRLLRRRVFRMAPIHHHFELAGWPETTVIVRFWILAGMCVALAIGIYYADYLSTGASG
ncbi:MAG TPA: phospho-N-acetylmuramoyl-pentapeptide-transferase [Acidimicrobiales bacterium]|nr:phospho-N-acetylmuramoyl-pentapeptide-transferase [Acidimicrobiales bacterium]